MLTVAGRTEGPLFIRIDRHGRLAVAMTRRGEPIGDVDGRLTGQAVAAVVARAAAAAGLDQPPAETRANVPPPRWSGHSLRRGFATARPARPGHDLVRVGRHGGWTDGSKSLPAYFDADRWIDNPLVRIGL